MVTGALLRLSARVHAAADIVEHRLVASPSRVPLVGQPHPDTAVWAYSGQVPGPTLRLRQGQRLRVLLENRLAEETTIHWHGIRVPNAMDGVPHLTQKPVAPGETFVYEFTVPDAGTYWYHPHQRSFEQVDRGLSGALIVDEPEPPAVDRDIVWVLDDWRLNRDASITDDFGNFMDVSMAGRLGNTVTINGRLPDRFAVRAGERVRLRIINAANARIFGLQFTGHQPRVIALDGQPVEPHALEHDRLDLGPAQRADLILDCDGRPGQAFAVVDSFYWQQRYKLVDIVYSEDTPLRTAAREPVRLPANPLSEPDLDQAQRHEIVFGGGMMGGGMMSGGMMGGMMGRGMMRDGMMGGADGRGIWTINGESATGHLHKPLLTLEREKSYVFAMHNDTAFHHPIHLHGHVFRVISRQGRPTRRREWLDTVLTAPNERVEIAFVADNPGDWMIHCHILEHQAGGMMGTFRI
jgi:FtsP/CotA-like multicopper oxidase with cupredoxin domain